MFPATKVAAGAVAGVLGLAVTGAAAFAAFQSPGAVSPTAIFTGDPSQVAAHHERSGERLAEILEGLVDDGTITAEQKDAILQAVQEARPDRPGKHRGPGLKARAVFGDLWHAAVAYFETERGELMRQLAQGTSLGEIADATEGKGRDGLVDALEAAANASIDDALGNGTISEERAAAARERVPQAVERFVDATRPGRPMRGR